MEGGGGDPHNGVIHDRCAYVLSALVMADRAVVHGYPQSVISPHSAIYAIPSVSLSGRVCAGDTTI